LAGIQRRVGSSWRHIDFIARPYRLFIFFVAIFPEKLIEDIFQCPYFLVGILNIFEFFITRFERTTALDLWIRHTQRRVVGSKRETDSFGDGNLGLDGTRLG
jgi:hypothetical protein